MGKVRTRCRSYFLFHHPCIRTSFLQLLLYSLMLVGVMRKIKIVQYVTMAAAFIFLGFYLNAAISIGNISSLLLGYFPSFRENTFWWLLVIGALVLPLILIYFYQALF